MLENIYSKKPLKTIALVLVALLLILALNGLWDLFAKWGWVSFTDTPRTITISAEGKTTVTPDTARFSVGVETRGDSPESVQEENTEAVNEIIEFLKGEGVSDEDIKTVNYNLFPQFNFIEGERIPAGYMLDQTVQVTVRDITRAGALLSGAVARGSNQVSSIQFFVDDPDIFKGEAREEAFAKARQKAEETTKQAGVRLGKVVSFSESSGGFPGPIFLERFDSAGVGGASLPSIEPGSQDITVTVSVTYEIK